LLGKEPYRPRVALDVDLPPIVGMPLSAVDSREISGNAVVIGAFGLEAGREIGIWQRLLDSQPKLASLSITLLVKQAWSARDIRLARDSLAPSRHDSTWAASDPERRWVAVVGPDRPERAFAAVVRGAHAHLLMVGAPTEEGWDMFQEHAEALIKGSRGA
jgi:hypothetical protein